MHSNIVQYFLNRKTNQLRRAASLPRNNINVAILTQAIYKLSSWNWKQVFLRREYFIHTRIHYPSSFHCKYQKTITVQLDVDLANTVCPQLEGFIYPHKGCSMWTHASLPCSWCRIWVLPSCTQALLHPRCDAAPTLHPSHRRPTRMKQRGSRRALCWSWSCLCSQDPHCAFSTRLLPDHCLQLGLHVFPSAFVSTTLLWHTAHQNIFTKTCWVNRGLGAPIFRKAQRGMCGLLEKPIWLFRITSCQHNPWASCLCYTAKRFSKVPMTIGMSNLGEKVQEPTVTKDVSHELREHLLQVELHQPHCLHGVTLLLVCSAMALLKQL